MYNDFVVDEIQNETKNIKVLYLKSTTSTETLCFSAGSHINVQLGNGLVRQYSLCPTSKTGCYKIAVSLSNESRGGSLWIHRNLQRGDILRCSAPRNMFNLSLNREHHIFIAGGIGITPFLSMIQYCREQCISYHIFYLAKNNADMAFKKFLQKDASSLTFHSSIEHGRRLDIHHIFKSAKSNSKVYVCGPDSLCCELSKVAKQFPQTPVTMERFTPKDRSAVSTNYPIRLASRDLVINTKDGESILEALEREKISIFSSCKTGICGTCVVKYSKAKVTHNDKCLSPRTRENMIAICVSYPDSDGITLDI